MDTVENYTNTNLDIMWTPSDSYDDKLNLILAGGGEDMPMIIATDKKSPAIINAARSGALWDIEQYLPDYPHLKNSKSVVNDNIRIDGKLYGVFRGRSLGRNCKEKYVSKEVETSNSRDLVYRRWRLEDNTKYTKKRVSNYSVVPGRPDRSRL